MSARSVLTGVVVVSAVVLGLTGCEKSGSSRSHGSSGNNNSTAQAPAPDTSATQTPVAKGSASPSRKATASPSRSTDADVVCASPTPIAGHKYIQAVKPPKQDTVYVKDAKFVCDPNDGHYEGAGVEKTYGFATKVTAQINAGPGALKTVPLGELFQHMGDCVLKVPVQDPYSCSGGIYDVALDSSGKITAIKEIWHP